MDNNPFPGAQPGDGNPTDGDSVAAVSPDIEWFAKRFRDARDKRQRWIEGDGSQTGADADFAFVAGFQWTEEDQEKLAEQNRVPVTFNRTGAFIDSVSGLEINNRQEVRFIPRNTNPGPAGVSELATGAVKWSRDDCDAEDEESAAFYDCLVCGEGWTQTTMNYDDDPDGQVIIEQRDPRKIFPNANSRKANYADMRQVFYVQDLEREEAEAQFPDVDPALLDAGWARDTEDEGAEPINRREASFYRDDATGKGETGSLVRIVECEWFEFEVAHRVVDPITGGRKHLTPDEFKALTEAHAAAGRPQPKSVKDKRKRYYRAILGSVVLAESNGPERGGFTLKAITGKRDRKLHQWYGLARAMRDPQMWSNKFLSQIMQIINTGAKSGLDVEVGALVDPVEAADTYAQPGAITLFNQGGLEKSRPKVPSEVPPGLQSLLQFAVTSISDAVGSNPEMMGQADRAQAGVTEEHRKQSAMTIFAGMFSSLRRYRKEQGRLHLWLIQTYISDGRLIRIGGDDQAKFVPLIRDQMLSEYDLVVDDTPTSPNMKERTWGAIVALFPILAKLELPPQIMMTLLKYSPLPSTLVSEVQQMIPPPQQGPNPQQQAEVQLTQAKAQHTQAAAAKMQVDAQKSMAEMQMVPMDKAEKQAKIELMKAQAINFIQDAAIGGDDARFEQYHAAIESLLKVASAHMDAGAQAHGQAMDQQAAAQGAQQQQFDQGMGLHQAAQSADQQQFDQKQAQQEAQQPQGSGE